MEQKLDSAQRKFNPSFDKEQALRKAQEVKQFSLELEKDAEQVLRRSKTSAAATTARRRSSRNEKTPSTVERTGYVPSSKLDDDGDDAYTPEQFKATASITGMTTDEQGNRCSILPGSSRPSKAKPASGDKNKAIASFASEDVEETKGPQNSMLEKLKAEQASFKPKEGAKAPARQNFVKMNAKMNYKPRIRGAAFTNKVMAKKTNSLKAKARFAKKMKIEELKNRDQVTMYGGLGKVGLDYQGKPGQENILGENDDDQNDGYQVPAFSAQAKQIIREKIAAAQDKESEEDDEMLFEGIDDMMDELKQIDEKVEDIEVDINDLDKAAYAVPDTDEGFKKILKERFGHDDFLEGQLDAIKILVQKRLNSLVVLATGGGKSLIYQYTTQFMPGLILVVTPLIALMTDQLSKLPDYIPGACINSQQSFPTKQAVL